ncbi:hypothetical protein BT93_F0390 [Corymbia citriodora subsp. variegata]|nr:hypothetical protein BT93_F0390 [Corymbia citriodora subsp. variegata]
MRGAQTLMMPPTWQSQRGENWGVYTLQRKNHHRSYINHSKGMRIGFRINWKIMGLGNKFQTETIELIQFQTIISSGQITTC